MAADLSAHGVAVGSVDELMPTDTELFDRAGQAACELLQERSVAEALSRARAATTTATKSYVLELLGRNPTFDPESPIVQLAMHAQLRGLIEQYVHMHLRLHDFNVWLNLPSGGERQLSQRWHRDEPDDRHILKAFIYLRDVPAGAGPLAYVRARTGRPSARPSSPPPGTGTATGSRTTSSSRPSAPSSSLSIPGPAGTIVVTDTRGYHRGGWAVDQERLVMMALYASRTSRKRRLIRPGPGIDAAGWSGEVAFVDHPD